MDAAEEHEETAEGGAEGAAVFPSIPADLQICPLLLAVLHALVFIEGSTDDIIDPDAADEAMDYLVSYLQRLRGPLLERVQEDMACLVTHAKQQGWPKQQQTFLKSFLSDFGIAGK
jgi:hypothetical protein